MRNLIVIVFLLLTACASKPPLAAPQWDAVPPHITDALCARLKMDAIATGSISIVPVTQPLVTPESLSRLSATSTKIGSREVTIPAVNRAIPIALGKACEWKKVDAANIKKYSDERIVELSYPILNAGAREVGMFARVTLGGDLPDWYWLALAPAEDQWLVRFIFVLSK